MVKHWLAGVLSLGCLSAPHAADIDVPGILSNETRSFAGREFYEAFVDSWQTYDPNGTVSLVINEKPAARTGTLITITYDRLPIFQRFISFNSRNARAAAVDASQRVYNVVLSGELERQFEGTELIGDGL